MRHSAFTLTEFFVIIAVIDILAGILFPVLAQARARSRQIHCASNTRQLALAVLMYAQDYGDTLLATAYTFGAGGDDNTATGRMTLISPSARSFPSRRRRIP